MACIVLEACIKYFAFPVNEKGVDLQRGLAEFTMTAVYTALQLFSESCR